MTATAMAAIATTQAAVAAQAAHEAEVSRCKTVLPTFNAQTATVTEKREYAGCVETMYPEEIGADATVVFKVLFFIALLGLATGAVAEYRNRNGVLDMCMTGILAFFVAPLAVGFVAAVCYGVVWLFS